MKLKRKFKQIYIWNAKFQKNINYKYKIKYDYIINWLSSGYRKKIVFILSHGGLHIIVLIILFIISAVLFFGVKNKNQILIKDLDITWQINRPIDLDYNNYNERNYEIKHLHINISPYYSQDPHNIRQLLVPTLCATNDEDSISLSVNLKSSKKSENKIYKESVIIANGDTLYFDTNVDNYIQVREDSIYYKPSTQRIQHNTILANLYSAKNSKIFFKINPKIIDSRGRRINNPVFADDNTLIKNSITITLGSHSIYNVYDTNKDGSIYLKDPWWFDKISPEPDEFAEGKFIKYYDPKKLKHIFNYGIVFSATEMVRADIENKNMILWNVLIGTILAFCLEIIVQLVIKWRNLNLRKKE